MAFSEFSFQLPTRIEFGAGIIKTVGEEAKKLGATKLMLVADKGVIAAGLTVDVETSLKKAGIDYIVYDGIISNPRIAHCEEAYRIAKAEKVDVLVAVGGGSSIDTAKAVGTLLTHGKTIQDWCGYYLLEREITPLIAIPTTCGTGSEVTPFAVVTDTETHIKLNIFDSKAAPKVALVDPTVLLKLPSKIMASTGVDAMTHAVEAYTCKLANPVTDAAALYAIELINKNLREAVKNPNLENCAGMMLGSMIAGIAFGYSDVGGAHCMAEAIGGRYDTPHGVACALFLPAITEYNVPADVEKHANMARYLGVDTKGMTAKEAAYAGVAALEQLCRDVGIPKLSEVDKVNPDDFEALAIASEKNVSTPSNAREITATDYFDLFKALYAL